MSFPLLLSALMQLSNPSAFTPPQDAVALGRIPRPAAQSAAADAANTPASRLAAAIPSLDDVIEAIRRSERAFQSVKMAARLDTQIQPNGSSEWQDHTHVSLRGWLANRPGGAARVEFTQHVCPWVDGKASFSESDYIASYDGRVGLSYMSRTGARGATFAVDRGSVVADRPNDVLWGVAAIGWRFTVCGFYDEEAIRMSEVLVRDREIARVDAAPELGKGVVRVTLEATKPVEARRTWTLDLERGAALLAYEQWGHGRQLEQITVDQLQPSRGLHLPKEARRQVWLPDATHREHLVVSAVELDPADVSESTFRIAFPIGTVLDDRVSDVVLTIGPSAPELQTRVAAQGAAVRQAMQNARPFVGLPPTAASAVDWLGIMRWAAGLLGAVIVGATLWRLRASRRAPQLASGLVLLGLLGAGALPAQQRSLGADELGTQRIFNCGLNAASVVLDAFGRPVVVEDVARSLDCGAHWENACSLRAMQLLFESRGLVVEAGKDAKPIDIVNHLDGQHVALLHCNTQMQGGHYLVLAAARDTSVFLVDPGVQADWVEFDWFVKRYEQRQSGYVLFVSAPQTKASATYTLQEDVITVDLGDVSDVDGMVSADIAVRNEGREPMTIVESRSGCSCFRGAAFVAGEKVLPAGAADTLRLSFDRGKFAIGKNHQQVYLGLLTPRPKHVLLRVSAVARSVEVSRRVTVMPARLDLGEVGRQSQQQDSRRITLLMPAGVSVRSVEATSPLLSWSLAETTTDPGGEYRAPTRTEAYEVTLTTPPAGSFAAEVVFQLSDEKLKTVRVPVTAERILR